jgi:hypothetical protein
VVKFVAAFAALALTGAAPAPLSGPLAADGYRFEATEFVQEQIKLRVVSVRSQEELDALGRENGITFRGRLRLRGLSRPAPGACTIYIVDQRITYAPEFLGHELAHCLYGEFHPERSRQIR